MSYKYITCLATQIFLLCFALSSEPMVILEYSNNKVQSESSENTDENFSTYHKIKKNETLSNIMQKYYGNKGLNFTFVQAAIIHKNKGAFVRGNPNFMYANKNLYLPSINEIKELVYHTKKKSNFIEETKAQKEIYFFGN